MSTLQKKLFRDLWRMRYQGFTIALLVGCGIASFVAAVAASASMQASRNAFYEDARFADIFANITRAPISVLDRLRELPGVTAVDGRAVGEFRLGIEGTNEPVVARFVSVRYPFAEGLNQTRIRDGRQLDPGRANEVLLSEVFANTWNIHPGDTITALVNERHVELVVAGIATSPEYSLVFSSKSGMADPRHFAVIWMEENALAKATDLVGAFNDVAISLAANADIEETRRRVDVVLEPYGGLGAVGRADQPSAKLTDQKIGQLDRLAHSLPVVFLGIAAFLLNVLLSRIVGTQREQIATLKALGYRTSELATHYLEFAAVICTVGVFFGILLGIAGAHGLLFTYAQYFKFPSYIFRFDAWGILGATLFAYAAGIGGSLSAVRRAVSIPPAEAMRPEAPPTYRATAFDAVYKSLSPIARMVLRDLQRRPFRLLLSAGSIALATSIVVAGDAFGDSINEVLRLQYSVSHREDITVTLDGARPFRAVSEIQHIPGVVHAEGERAVPVRLRAGQISHTTSLLGISPDAKLHHLLGADRKPFSLPEQGLSMSRALADILHVSAGDDIDVEVLEANREHRRVRVLCVVDDLLGVFGYMNIDELSELLREAPRVNIVLASVDTADVDDVMSRINLRPGVGVVSRPQLDRDLVRAEVADAFAALSVMLALFASTIAVGVVYNNARIALETRSRDLATMRILGFTRGELAAVLLSEQAIQIFVGVFPGLFLGKALGVLWLKGVDPELMRVPIAISTASYVSAASVVILAGFASALVVRRRADRLDLVAVLKARD